MNSPLGLNLAEQMVQFFPIVCTTDTDILNVAAAMKEFARANPYDHIQKKREIEACGDRVAVVGPWEKYVTFDNGVTPPFRLMYTEGPMPGLDGVLQFLCITDLKKTTLKPLEAVAITSCFWDKNDPAVWGSLEKHPGVPANVGIVLRKVKNGETL